MSACVCVCVCVCGGGDVMLVTDLGGPFLIEVGSSPLSGRVNIFHTV